jgi:putative SOS response-associated peptidase YedK
MCGRFAQTTHPDDLVRLFKLVLGLDLTPRYNVAPTQDVLIIRGHPEGRRAHSYRWGLIPPWAEDLRMGARMINARSETVFDKASFKTPVRRQRCIIPVSGFYEWQKSPTGRDPLLFTDPGGAPLSLAGIWSTWQAPDSTHVQTTSILTTQANQDLAPVHHRMPVILDGASMDVWLDERITEWSRLQPVLQPAPDHRLVSRAVSRYVNSVQNEGRECWDAAE